MNIENLDIKIIEKLSFAYDLAAFEFGNIIETKNIKKQNKIKNWLFKKVFNNQEFSKDIVNQLNNMQNNELFNLLESCSKHIKSVNYACSQETNIVLNNFSSTVKHAFSQIFDVGAYCYDDFKCEENSIEITVDSSASYEVKLILLNTKISTDEAIDTLLFYESALTKENDIYKLTAEACLKNEIEDMEITISFTSAKTEIKYFNPINLSVSSSPWEQLIDISASILEKEKFENSLNALEQELLPLLKEIEYLSPFYYNTTVNSCSNFKALILKHNFCKLLPLVEKIESSKTSEKQKTKLSQKLINKLNLIKHKPLWQEIYDLISESQKRYDLFVAYQKPKSTLTKLKNKTNKIMQEYGYSGEYPDYYKKSALKGIHLLDSYDISYTVAFHKNTVHHIHCEENLDVKSNLCLNFLYGNEFLKKNDTMSDINSCRFNCNGKKHASYVIFNANFDETSNTPLEERISIVTKKAEFKRLNKYEKSKVFNNLNSFSDKFILFVIMSLLFGFFFASLFIPAMMAFTALMLWLDGMPIILNDIPWLAMYFGTFVFSGVSMGIITVITKSK